MRDALSSSGSVRRTAFAAAAALLLAAPARANAQGPTRPWADWRTVETGRIVVHYPAELADWSLATAARMESIQDAVTAFVGYEPEETVTVIVDDPANRANGSAWPGPVVLLYPVPPEPASMIAGYREWGELLAVHELAHVAHFARPSRNPRDRWLRGLLPLPYGPILTRAPRWALEGYATLIEGELTGSGRPHGAWRPAVLRTWALDGALPGYGALDRTDGFLTAAMAYLAGSAYLEWLVEGEAEAELPKVWRRLSARAERGFDEAFAGVFGAPPAELYGAFTVALTERALAVEDAVEAVGVEIGQPFQRLEGWTASPAVSPDGERVVVVRQPEWDEPAEVVVWTTAEDTLTAEERRARARALELDPEDVEAVEWRPRPKEPLARLGPVAGRGHGQPRWLPDGESIVVVRWEPLGDGRFRPDLFEWRWREGSLRRVTEGAAIREADPDPSGRSAVGTRCLAGACDLVRIDLAGGAVEVLAAGEVGGRSYHGPRVGPDGRIVASVFEAGGWWLALLDADGREIRALSPPEAPPKFDAAWAGPDRVVAVSEAGGIHDLERIDVATGAAVPLTRVVTAALAPAPAPDGSVLFLHLTSRGLDLRRVDGEPVAGPAVVVAPDLAPAAPVPPVEVPAFPTAEVGPGEPYGLGPRSRVVLPAGYAGPEGWAVGGIVHGSDPVGRLGWELGGLWGSGGAWRGVTGGLAWRGWRPELRAQGFLAREEPSEQDLDGAPAAVADLDIGGGVASIGLERMLGAGRWQARAGGSAARIEIGPAGEPGDEAVGRSLAFAEAGLARLRTAGGWRLVGRARLHGAAGRTDGEGWRRGIAAAGFEVGPRDGPALAVEGLWGATDGGSGGFEAFAFGGAPAPLLDPAVLSQRLAEPSVPVGWATGTRAASVRLAWRSDGGETFYRWVSAGPELGDWKRVIGSEVRFRTDPVPFLGLPAVDLGFGVARLLDPPLDGETRFHARVRYRP